MDYEQFKERIEEDLHQALADHGIDANFSQHHVEKLNVSYDALSVTPEGSHIGVKANLSAMFEAIENGLRLSLIESLQISLMSVRGRVWGIGIPIKRLTQRYAIAIKWRYGNTWVDFALYLRTLLHIQKMEGKIQGVRKNSK